MSELKYDIDRNGMSIKLSENGESVSAYLATQEQINDPEARAQSVVNQMDLEKRLQDKINS